MVRTRPIDRMLRLAGATSLALLALAGCNDRTSDPRAPYGGGGSGAASDVGFVETGVIDRPIPSLCRPGTQRCLTENSPLFERCRDDGEGFERRSCDDGEVCRDRRCAPFACVPGRSLCVGTTTRATCDTTGSGVVDRAECGGDDVCLGGQCVDACATARAANSYVGCDYVAEILPNFYEFENYEEDDAYPPWAVVVANPDPLLNVEVSARTPDGDFAPLIDSVTLSPPFRFEELGETTIRSEVLDPRGVGTPMGPLAEAVRIGPRSAGVFLLDDPQDPLSSFHLSSSRPVVAYQFSPYCCNYTFTNDASLLLPTNTWQQRYRVLSYPAPEAFGGLASYVRIVATEQTQVRVDSPVPVMGPGEPSFRQASFSLGPGAPLTLWATEATGRDRDISGIELEADAPIAVFTGNPCVNTPHDKWACDHLEEQLLPASTLGRRYALTPTRKRNDGRGLTIEEATYWRLVADEEARIEVAPSLDEIPVLPPSNEMTRDCRDLIDDTGEIVLAAGGVCEFGSLTPVGMTSTGRLIVGGVISGHQSTGVNYYGTQAGDPSLFVLPPVEQFRSDYSFVAPPTYARTYVAVAIAAGSALALDGRNVDEASRLERRSLTIDGRSWEAFNVAIEPGVHQMESDTPFGIVVYAYDDFVSYAFTGGLDLLPKGAGP